MRDSWTVGSAATSTVAALKAGVFGGRGNYEGFKSCVYGTTEFLNYGHDHEDDLGLWIYGKGGWLLPEAVAYNCCYQNNNYQKTDWQNTLLIDGRGQLGDDKVWPRANTKLCGTDANGNQRGPAWFYARDAKIVASASTAHYAFTRGDGRKLYPADLKVNTLLRTFAMSRELGAFMVLQDRAEFGTPRKLTQVFHSLNPTNTDFTSPWIRMNNDVPSTSTSHASNTVLGIKVLSPTSGYAATPSSQTSNTVGEFVDNDGIFGRMDVTTTTASTSATFLEFLWPTTTAAYGTKPTVTALDSSFPDRGFSTIYGASTEAWLYNTVGGTTSAGGLTLEGTAKTDIGIRRTDTSTGAVERVVLFGSGRLRDSSGSRTLLDLGSGKGVLEVAFTGTTAADLTGTAPVVGVQFYAPTTVTTVTRNGQAVGFSRSGTTITVTSETAGPAISNVAAISITNTGATITFDTSVQARGEVEYGRAHPSPLVFVEPP